MFSGQRLCLVYGVLFYAANIFFILFGSVLRLKNTTEHYRAFLLLSGDDKISRTIVINLEKIIHPSIHLYTFYRLLQSGWWGSAGAPPWSRVEQAGFHPGHLQENDPLPKKVGKLIFRKTSPEKFVFLLFS